MQNTDLKPLRRSVLKSALVYGAVGNCLGYFNGKMEFNVDPFDGVELENSVYASDYLTLKLAGRLGAVDMRRLRLSDEFVMLLAGVQAVEHLVAHPREQFSAYMNRCAELFVEALDLLRSRHPGGLLFKHLSNYKKGNKWPQLAYGRNQAHANVLVRTFPIAIHFRNNESEALRYAAFTARLTHNHLFSIYGAAVFAHMVMLALRGAPPAEWAASVIQLLESGQVDEHIHLDTMNIPYRSFQDDKEEFLQLWYRYRELRYRDGVPAFDYKFHIPSFRSSFYLKHFGGAAEQLGSEPGTALVMALDALIYCENRVEQLAHIACFHVGKGDITGSIAFLLFGLTHPLALLPQNLADGIEALPEILQLLDLEVPQNDAQQIPPDSQRGVTARRPAPEPG